MVVNLSGRGDKDVPQVAEMLGTAMTEHPLDTRFARLPTKAAPASSPMSWAGDPDRETALRS
jgi:hypothetical protein